MSDQNNGNAPDSGDQTNDQKKAQAAPDAPAAKGEHMVPKARLDEVIAQRKRAEGVIQGVVEELREDIPEEFRDLIPDLEPTEQVKWIRGAIRKGLFTQPNASGPDAKRPGGKPPTDFENLSPGEMRAMGYKN